VESDKIIVFKNPKLPKISDPKYLAIIIPPTKLNPLRKILPKIELNMFLK
jgi:hypothetical protein